MPGNLYAKSLATDCGYATVMEQCMERIVTQVPNGRCITGHTLVDQIGTRAYVTGHAQTLAAFTDRQG